MTTDETKETVPAGAKGDKIEVKRADLEAYRRKMSRARRTLDTASALLDELEQEYDRLIERMAG